MKKIVRIAVLCLAFAGVTASFAATTASFSGGGDPVPLCDPGNPTCQVIN